MTKVLPQESILSEVFAFLRRNYYAAAAVAFGLAFVVVYLWAKDFEPVTFAQVLGAFGSVVAAIVALVIAAHGAQQSTRNEAKHAAAAAILVSENLYYLRAVVDVIHENKQLVLNDPDGYAQWLSVVVRNIAGAKPIIEDRHLPAVVGLPTLDLYTLAIADSWLRSFKARCTFRDAVTVAEVIEKFDATLEEILRGRVVVVGASNRMFDLSGIGSVGGKPPWQGTVPSWATPERIV